MSEQKIHEMSMGIEHPDGSQEWFCLECGHQIYVQWEPVFKVKTVELGDKTATHTGALGGLQMGAVGIKTEPSLATVNGNHEETLH